MGSIRFLLAAAVVLYHSYHIMGVTMTGGLASVQAFYIISGFYMALILNEKYTPGKGVWKLFITNRLLRLYPIYFVVLLLVLLLSATGIVWKQGYFGVWDAHGAKFSIGTWFYYVISHITVIGQELASYLFIDYKTGLMHFTADFYMSGKPYAQTYLMIPQAWSIGVEICFYLVAPLLVRRKWFIQAGIIIATLVLRWYLFKVMHFNYAPWTYRFFPLELGMFMLGSLAWLVWKNYVSQRTWPKELSVGLWCAVVTSIVVFGNLKLDEQTKIWSFYALFVVALPFIFELTKNSKIDRWVGELSYPIYIVHHLCLMLIKPFIWDGFEYLAWFGFFSLAASIGAALLLNRFVSAPIERFREKRVKMRLAAAA